MLATILKGKKATQMTLQIMDAFVLMKKYISEEKTIIYEGKIYDAYSTMIDIFNESKKEIIIIDNYVNKELLDILRNTNKIIIIISKNIDNELKIKYKKQYSNVTFINKNPFHDRYIILDKEDVYVSGMSLKDIGKKYKYINKINECIFI